MSVVTELFRSEENGTLSFGDYTLDTKAKKDKIEFEGDMYKVKTFKTMTKLEVEPEQEYRVYIDNINVGNMKANLGGKLTLSVELNPGMTAMVRVKKQ